MIKTLNQSEIRQLYLSLIAGLGTLRANENVAVIDGDAAMVLAGEQETAPMLTICLSPRASAILFPNQWFDHISGTPMKAMLTTKDDARILLIESWCPLANREVCIDGDGCVFYKEPKNVVWGIDTNNG